MIGFIASLCIVALLPSVNATSASVSLSASLTAQVRSRQLGHSRKLLTVDDPTMAIDGHYIMVFDNDKVNNVTAKVENMFVKEHVNYIYDNIALKGAAIRNVTAELLDRLEGDSDILFIAPVRIGKR